MCGIVGYTGKSNALPILLEGLKKLEYRGYDSAGVALLENVKEGNQRGRLHLLKEKGEILNLEKKIRSVYPSWFKNEDKVKFEAGVAHTRWATHGVPSEINAHPHMDCSKSMAVVHNGIIENHAKLRKDLEEEGHRFISDTDTEVVVHLFEKYYAEEKVRWKEDKYSEYDFLHAVAKKTVEEIEGSYALVFLISEHPGVLVAARYRSPLVVGLGDEDIFIASDVSPLLAYTRDTIFLEDGDIVVASKNDLKIWDGSGAEVKREVLRTEWDVSSAEKGGYKHFMLKEIFEQRLVVHEAIGLKLNEFDDKIYDSFIKEIEKFEIIACGTSYHAGLVGKYFLEKVADVPVHVYHASEYRYSPRVGHRGLAIAISQSGETADTIAAIEAAKKFGHRTLAITNVLGSTITRMVDKTIYMVAGPEIGVAATKTFTNQLIVLYLLGMRTALLNGEISPDHYREMVREIRELPRCVEFVLNRSEEIRGIAERYASYNNMLFIGRNIHYPVALEGALKLKEISYIHAEGYPSGELKHGPIALLSEETPTVAVVVRDHTYEKTISNIGEVVARNSPVVIVAEEGDEEVEMYSDDIIRIPKISSYFSPVPASIALQLFAYYIADVRGCEIDKPRNLAKSVTVE